HHKLAWEMLHNIVIGPLDIDNTYFAAFLKGFLLPCATGIDLVDIVRSFFGGPEEFIRTAEMSTIHHFASLNISISCDLKQQSLDKLAQALSTAGPQFTGKTFQDIIEDFLAGTGAPCPELLASMMDRFSPEVKTCLSGLQSPTFRMRLMCWAVTGATRVLLEGEPMQIVLVEDDDVLYLPSDIDDSDLYLSMGSCSFRTCSSTYDPNVELGNPRVAIHHWLLVQMLDNAGTYNMV
ncbi:hypothetical protein F5877DRAFT_54321, partial [Lentinula edodes]